MSLWRRKLNASDIELVLGAESFSDPREPSLRIGQFVCLNSGGPTMMVVDHGAAAVIVAWQDCDGMVYERSYPCACVHRVSPSSAGSAAPYA